MADMRFACPHCKQDVQCDSAWAGQVIQCPICQGQMTVPQGQAPPPASGVPSIATAAERNNPLVPKPPAQSKLTAGKTQVARSTSSVGAPQRQFQQTAHKGPKTAVKLGIVAAVILVIGGGGFAGWTLYQKNEARKAEEARKVEEAKRETERQEREARAAAERAARLPKDLPVLPPTYTLDSTQAKIAESKVNGKINGNPFVAELTRIVHNGNVHILSFSMGPATAPDRLLGVAFRLPPEASLTNQTIEATPEARNPLVTSITKMIKTDPRYAAKRETVSSGYLLKLETGSMTNGMIPGKIFLATRSEDPTNETVIAGMFLATIFVPDPNAVQAATAAQPVQPVQVANPNAKAAMDRRYNGRKRGP